MPGKIFRLELEVPGSALGQIISGLKADSEEAWVRYPVTLEIPETQLGPIITGLVAAQVKIGNMTDTGKRAETSKTQRERGYVGGKKDKGITGRALVMEILTSRSGLWRADEISQRFVERGFAGGSWGPPISELVNEGKVRKVGPGVYALPGFVVRPGDPPIAHGKG